MEDRPITRRVVLELWPESGRIAGMLTDDRGATCRFSGWLELVAALDDAWAGEDRRARPGSAVDEP